MVVGHALITSLIIYIGPVSTPVPVSVGFLFPTPSHPFFLEFVHNSSISTIAKKTNKIGLALCAIYMHYYVLATIIHGWL